MISTISASMLTQKQQSAVDAVRDAIRDLGMARTPTNQRRTRVALLAAGSTLHNLVKRLESQLIDFDKTLAERGTTNAEDDLWITNLGRLTTMLSVLADAKTAA
jgi:hypothetical protein